MRTRDTLRLRVFRYFEKHVQPDDQPRSLCDVADVLGLDRRQVEIAVSGLVKLKCVAVCGGTARTGLLYCAVPGATAPIDRRGKHKQHKTGPAWAAARKRQRNLARARAARQLKRTKEKLNADLPAFARWFA